MKYQIMRETTTWEDGLDKGRHVYIFIDFKRGSRSAMALAFCPFGTYPVKKFVKPLAIDLRGRTFEAVQ